MTSKKDSLELTKALRGAGVSVGLTRNGHYRVEVPGADFPVCYPSTPSDVRSLRNVLAQLNRLGVQFEFRGRSYGKAG